MSAEALKNIMLEQSNGQESSSSTMTLSAANALLDMANGRSRGTQPNIDCPEVGADRQPNNSYVVRHHACMGCPGMSQDQVNDFVNFIDFHDLTLPPVGTKFYNCDDILRLRFKLDLHQILSPCGAIRIDQKQKDLSHRFVMVCEPPCKFRYEILANNDPALPMTHSVVEYHGHTIASPPAYSIKYPTHFILQIMIKLFMTGEISLEKMNKHSKVKVYVAKRFGLEFGQATRQFKAVSAMLHGKSIDDYKEIDKLSEYLRNCTTYPGFFHIWKVLHSSRSHTYATRVMPGGSRSKINSESQSTSACSASVSACVSNVNTQVGSKKDKVDAKTQRTVNDRNKTEQRKLDDCGMKRQQQQVMRRRPMNCGGHDCHRYVHVHYQGMYYVPRCHPWSTPYYALDGRMESKRNGTTFSQWQPQMKKFKHGKI